MSYVAMGAPPPKGKTADPSYYKALPQDYVPPGTVAPEATPESNTTLIIGAVAAVAVIGGAIFFLSRRG